VHYKSFISGALSDAARDYWYEKFQKEQDKKIYSEEDMRECWKVAYDESFNKWIKGKPKKTFTKWLKQFKNK
jgi:hypothetical protein